METVDEIKQAAGEEQATQGAAPANQEAEIGTAPQGGESGAEGGRGQADQSAETIVADDDVLTSTSGAYRELTVAPTKLESTVETFVCAYINSTGKSVGDCEDDIGRAYQRAFDVIRARARLVP